MIPRKNRNSFFPNQHWIWLLGWCFFFLFDLFSLLYITVIWLEADLKISAITNKQQQLFFYALILFITLMLIAFCYWNCSWKRRKTLQKMQLMHQIEQNQMYQLLLKQRTTMIQQEQHSFQQYLHQLVQQADVEKMESIVEQMAPQIEIQKLTGYPMLDVLFSEKMYQAKASAIHLQIDYQPNVRFGQQLEYDICIILGNLLDNAFAAADCGEKSVVCVLRRKNEYMNLISVRNSCQAAPVLVNGLPVSKNMRIGHGYGTKIIQGKVKQYRGDCMFSYDDVTKMFSADILLPVGDMP